MNQSIRVFIEYKIQADAKVSYEAHMPAILSELTQEGATNIEWFEACDQPLLYVEMFDVSSLSHYQRLKELRQIKTHTIFGALDHSIDGGIVKLHCWAFAKKK